MYLNINIKVRYMYFYLVLNCFICIHPHGQKTILQGQSSLNVCTKHRKNEEKAIFGSEAWVNKTKEITSRLRDQ